MRENKTAHKHIDVYNSIFYSTDMYGDLQNNRKALKLDWIESFGYGKLEAGKDLMIKYRIQNDGENTTTQFNYQTLHCSSLAGHQESYLYKIARLRILELPLRSPSLNYIK